jgi:hypothetical protein
VDQAVESSEMSENYMKAQNGFDISEKPKAQCPGSQKIQSLRDLVVLIDRGHVNTGLEFVTFIFRVSVFVSVKTS